MNVLTAYSSIHHDQTSIVVRFNINEECPYSIAVYIGATTWAIPIADEQIIDRLLDQSVWKTTIEINDHTGNCNFCIKQKNIKQPLTHIEGCEYVFPDLHIFQGTIFKPRTKEL